MYSPGVFAKILLLPCSYTQMAQLIRKTKVNNTLKGDKPLV